MTTLRPMTLTVEVERSLTGGRQPVFHLLLTTDFGLVLQWRPFDVAGAYLQIFPLSPCCGAQGTMRPIPGPGGPLPQPRAVHCGKCRRRAGLPVESVQLERASFGLADWRMSAAEQAALATLVDTFLDPVEAMIYASALEDLLIEIMVLVESESKGALQDTRAHLDLHRQEAILHHVSAYIEGRQ